MTAALKTLNTEPGRRLALLGEMLELGEASVSAHAGLAPLCTDLDGVLLVGEGMKPLSEALGGRARWHEAATPELLEAVAGMLETGDTLLVKGSNRVFWAHRFVPRLIERLTS
jgi:UDP-N-acetylmuramoyl-tripeptide--D-alanyl-D-alanine ligase